MTLDTRELTKAEWRKLLTTLTFQDADEEEVQAYDYQSGAGIVRLPRGVLNLIPGHVKIDDRRTLPKMPKMHSVIELDADGRTGQSEAVRAMFEKVQGQIIAPPGRGKTEIVLAFAAGAKTRTLVIVHTQDLLKQWVDRARVSVPGMKVGTIQGKSFDVEHLTIAMAQTLRKHLDHPDFLSEFGAIVIDEAHHAAADTWEWVLNSCPAYYRFGVTASEKRSDGRQALVKFNVGPVIYKIRFKSDVPIAVQPVATKFTSRYNATKWTSLVRDLVENEPRNELIAKVVLAEMKQGNTVLVLSRQIKHLEYVHDMVVGDNPMLKAAAKIVTGRLPKSVRDDLISRLRDGTLRCILGTQLFEEGVDIPRLNRIVLAFPGTDITVLQKVGRGTRQAEGKSDLLVYDIVDPLVAVLGRQYIERKHWYKRVGIDIRKVVKDGPEKKKRRLLHSEVSVSRPHRS